MQGFLLEHLLAFPDYNETSGHTEGLLALLEVICELLAAAVIASEVMDRVLAALRVEGTTAGSNNHSQT